MGHSWFLSYEVPIWVFYRLSLMITFFLTHPGSMDWSPSTPHVMVCRASSVLSQVFVGLLLGSLHLSISILAHFFFFETESTLNILETYFSPNSWHIFLQCFLGLFFLLLFPFFFLVLSTCERCEEWLGRWTDRSTKGKLTSLDRGVWTKVGKILISKLGH